jgi:RNase P subunit RPR2
MSRKKPPVGKTPGNGLKNERMMLTGMSEWRQQHPTATLREIEEAMDERLNKLRARMLEDLVKMSPQADWRASPKEERPVCERCGKPLVSRGKQRRQLQTSGGQQGESERSDGTCPDGGQGLFPLDKELGLTSSDRTPRAQEGLVRLASWRPFARAAQVLESLVGVHVSKASARRATLQTGTLLDEEWNQQAVQLQEETTVAPTRAPQQVFSADGAMVPLVAGIGAEVKTLAIGTVEAPKEAGKAVHVRDLSYCSRLTDVPGFEQATLVEIHRRGVEQACAVAAVMDGADWLQGVIDYHRADAVRILDVPHAAEYANAIGEAVRAAGFSLPKTWLEGVLHRLKHEGPERVLSHLARLSQRCGTPEVHKKWQYLLRRHDQMQYPRFQQENWPIGSGMVESANTVVVEARLKGSGMHWERANVNAMLVLRTAVCNDRWEETWMIAQHQHQQRQFQRRAQLAQKRRDRAAARLLDETIRWQLARSVPKPPPPVPLSTPPAPSAPKGRTEAQYRWGRQPMTPKGRQIHAQFAKK